ncbi:MAG: efflux RND transporter periplasmic adaptor subunit [Sediminibacterium sp.]|nr:efflux RND transporter periplasmic adaptor subunit [Sediminibacterium sp.]
MKNVLYISSALILLSACGGKTNGSLEELTKREGELKTELVKIQEEIKKLQGDSAKKVTLVELMTVTPQVFKSYIKVQGHVEAEENVSVSSEMPGTITRIHVKAGQEVSKGTVLAETDARVIQQSISDLQTNAELINQLYEKQKALWDQKIGTEVQFLSAKAQKESMDKKLATLQEQLRMTKIISPIDGTIDAVDIKLGQLTAPGMPAIRIINFSNMKIKADLAEAYAARVHKNDMVNVIFPDTKDSLTAMVSYAARAINPMTRTFGVEIRLDNKREYHPNQIAEININDYTSAKPVVVVSSSVVQTDGSGGHFIMVAEGKKAVKKFVKLGRAYNGQVEIQEGLATDAQIISKGYDGLNDGDLIKTL